MGYLFNHDYKTERDAKDRQEKTTAITYARNLAVVADRLREGEYEYWKEDELFITYDTRLETMKISVHKTGEGAKIVYAERGEKQILFSPGYWIRTLIDHYQREFIPENTHPEYSDSWVGRELGDPPDDPSAGTTK